jgi:hypothetical protein
MVNEARKSHRGSASDGDEPTQPPSSPPSSPRRAKALPLPPAESFISRSVSIPAPLLDEFVRREYWIERAWQEGELADAASAAAAGALPPEPHECVTEARPAPRPVRPREADPSFDVGEDPWGLAGQGDEKDVQRR